MRISGEAPAKINRELRVGGVRSDGYHEIRSRVVAIDLADSIEVETGDGDLTLSCEGFPVPSDESNLAVRAGRALANHLGRPADAAIRLKKKIPVGAGLGGGSSDAARALALLARLWGAGLTREDLRVLAASLGSDVPFFLVGGEAEVTGRGDSVRPLPDSEPLSRPRRFMRPIDGSSPGLPSTIVEFPLLSKSTRPGISSDRTIWHWPC